ncbi:unnamed protein product, partial [Ectocarpus sp. 13 AM-2016]
LIRWIERTSGTAAASGLRASWYSRYGKGAAAKKLPPGDGLGLDPECGWIADPQEHRLVVCAPHRRPHTSDFIRAAAPSSGTPCG